MAEYVKKENIIDIIDNSSDLQEVKSCMMYGLETADVVERSKIDKAIEEMTKYSESFIYAGKRDLASAVENCIYVLKKYIGE